MQIRNYDITLQLSEWLLPGRQNKFGEEVDKSEHLHPPGGNGNWV